MEETNKLKLSFKGGSPVRKPSEIIDVNDRLEQFVGKVRDLSIANLEMKKRIEELEGRDFFEGKVMFEERIKKLEKGIQIAMTEKGLVLNEISKKEKLLGEKDEYIRALEKKLGDEERRRINIETKLKSTESESHFAVKIYLEEIGMLKAELAEHEKKNGEFSKSFTEEALKRREQEKEELKKELLEEREVIIQDMKLQIEILEGKYSAVSIENTNLRIEVTTRIQEIHVLKAQMNELKNQTRVQEDKFEATQTATQKKISRLESIIQEKELEIERLKKELEKKTQQYEEQLNVNIALTFEVNNWQKILKNEETKLVMYNADELYQHSNFQRVGGNKRKRLNPDEGDDEGRSMIPHFNFNPSNFITSFFSPKKNDENSSNQQHDERTIRQPKSLKLRKHVPKNSQEPIEGQSQSESTSEIQNSQEQSDVSELNEPTEIADVGMDESESGSFMEEEIIVPKTFHVKTVFTKGNARFEELDVESQFLRIHNLTKDKLSLHNCWIQLSNPSEGVGTRKTHPRRFRFPHPEESEIQPFSFLIVRVAMLEEVENISDPAVHEKLLESTPLTWNDIGIGTCLQLCNHDDEVITEATIVDASTESRSATLENCSIM